MFRSSLILVFSLAISVLAVMMVFWGFVADLNIELVTMGLVAAFLAAYLALRGQVSGGGSRLSRFLGCTRVVVGVFALCVLGAGLVMVYGIGQRRPDSAQDNNPRPPQAKMDLALRTWPSDGEDRVAPDIEFVIEISGAQFRDGAAQLNLELARGSRGTIGLRCEMPEDDGRVIRCSSTRPLLFDTEYKAVFDAPTRGADGKVGKFVTKAWSFSTASRYSVMRGISPGLIQYEKLSDTEISVQARPGTLPANGVRQGWRVAALGAGSFRHELDVAGNGGFGGVVLLPRQRGSSPVANRFLEVTTASGETVARLPWGPEVSNSGRTVHFRGQRPFRYLTLDGVLLVYDGDLAADEMGTVSIQRLVDSCADFLPFQLDCASSWDIAYSHPGSGRWLPHQSKKAQMKAQVLPPEPAVDVLFPAPEEVSDSLLIFDSFLKQNQVPQWHRKRFLLAGIGRVRVLGEGRFISFRERFPVVGGGELVEIEPTKVYSQGLAGTHHLLYGRHDDVTVIVGDYSGNNHENDWKVHFGNWGYAHESRLNLAAPLPVYSAAAFSGENRTLAILPVIPGQPIALTSIDPITGWISARVYLDSASNYSGAIQYVGDLDQIRSDQR